MSKPLRHLVLPLITTALAALAVACGSSTTCETADDCFAGEICYEGNCAPDNGGGNNANNGGADAGNNGGSDAGNNGGSDTGDNDGSDTDDDTGTTGPTVVGISGGGQSTCARFASGEVKCWGRNLDGEIGNGETSNQEPSPITVQNRTDATRLESGHSNHCAFAGDGKVYCWGSNGSEQITPDESVDDIPLPTDMGFSTATDVAVADRAICVLLEGGSMNCAGTSEDPVIYAVPDFSESLRSIEAGFHHACAVLESRNVQCWGTDRNGEVDGAGTVDNLPSIETLALGGNHSCALSTAGSVYCWGTNQMGELGIGSGETADGAVQVPGLEQIVDIVAGFSHTCALDTNGAVNCWGSDGADFFETTPSGIFGLDAGVEKITAGSYHTCALIEDGDVFCWGRNAEGQLGDGTQNTPSRPVQVAF